MLEMINFGVPEFRGNHLPFTKPIASVIFFGSTSSSEISIEDLVGGVLTLSNAESVFDCVGDAADLLGDAGDCLGDEA